MSKPERPIDTTPRSPATRRAGRTRPSLRGLFVIGLVLLLAAGGGAIFMAAKQTKPVINTVETTIVQRGDLDFTVSEGGTLKAERLERITSKVEDTVTLIYIVPEGTEITEDDVRSGKVLVELDASALKEKLTKQEITVQGARASYAKAKEDYEIQLKQNESNIRTAELNVKFARMELEQYLGKELADEVNDRTDFASLGQNPKLGGAALQRRRKLESDVQLAQAEIERATDKFEWTQKLFEKKYVTRNELMADDLALRTKKADLEQARLALDLFLRYELPKEAEKRAAEWREKCLERDRVRAKADSELAQALAKLKSEEATYGLELESLNGVKKQVEYCTIRAEKPGLVVYASSTDWWQRSRNPIQEGTSIRERQEIIHLPDLSSMVAEIKVHESVVKKVRPGQPATITVDAYPELRLTGKVKTVAALPDPQNWMQDVKLFTTIVTIDGSHTYLKPGMTCRAEIVIKSLTNALYVPISAIVPRGERKVCYLVNDQGQQPVFVETGEFDDRFVEIKSGLREGDRVLLNPPLFATEQKTNTVKGKPANRGERSDERKPRSSEQPAPPTDATPSGPRPSATPRAPRQAGPPLRTNSATEQR